MEEKEQYIYVNGRFVKVGGTDGVEFKEVSSLPAVGEDGVIYLLPSEEGQGGGGGTSIKVDGETVPELEVGDGLAVENGVLNLKILTNSSLKLIDIPNGFYFAQISSGPFNYRGFIFIDGGGGYKNVNGVGAGNDEALMISTSQPDNTTLATIVATLLTKLQKQS